MRSPHLQRVVEDVVARDLARRRAVGARKQVSIFIVVDLPAPFGPRKPSTSPLRTLNVT